MNAADKSESFSGNNQQSFSGLNQHLFSEGSEQSLPGLQDISSDDKQTAATVNNLICSMCNKSYEHSRSLRRHIKKCHPVDNQENLDDVQSSALKSKFHCDTCDRAYESYRSLRRHVLTFHPSDIQNLVPPSKVNSNFEYKCDICNKNFNKKYHLMHHKRNMHNDNTYINTNYFLCPICGDGIEKKVYADHVQLAHDISFEIENFQFSSFSDFSKWKDNIECNSNSKYSKYRGAKQSGSQMIHYFSCHRSGFHCRKGEDRVLKSQGSNKINGHCPASLKVVESSDGTCQVTFNKTHVGHVNDIGHLSLSETERQALAAKIALKIPFDTILDEIRDSVSVSDPQRIHLLTKKDLHNINDSFNLSADVIHHKNDALSVEAWVNKMNENEKSSVLFYKPQGETSPHHPHLKDEDFVLIIMNEAQGEILKKYGHDCICIDGTHGLNNYGFELITLLTIDDLREGFPCAFLISNRSDEAVLNIFFSKVYNQVGKISPYVFMSDMAEAFYNAWVNIHSPSTKRLYCTWHVDNAWRKNLPKIKNQDKQIYVYKVLRTLLEQLDAVTFEDMLQQSIRKFLNDEDTAEFGKYFRDHYYKNKTSWAYCYRLYSGLNTNMHIERMHRTIKYIYLKGKNVKRLDKALHAIMKFVRDKLFDRLIAIHKGKLTSKLKDLRNKHKLSTLIMRNVTKTDYGWDITSSGDDKYKITENNINCKCSLICTECNACIHKYSCSCLDYAVKWNMCKHIHYICQHNTTNTIDTTHNMKDNINDLTIIDESQESQVIMKELNNKSSQQPNTNSMASKLQKREILKQKLCGWIDKLETQEEFEAFEKLIAPIPPTLDAIRSRKRSLEDSQNTKHIPANKNIQQQRHFYSTKKPRIQNRKKIQKPSAAESKSIALTLLHDIK